MWVTVCVFLYFESQSLLFQHHSQINIERSPLQLPRSERVKPLIRRGWGVFVFFLHISACEFLIQLYIHVILHKIRMQVFYFKESPFQIHHWAGIAVFIIQNKRRHPVLFGHPVVISPKCGSYVYYSRTIFGSNKVTCHHAESTITRIYPGNKLFVFQSHKVSTFHFGKHFVLCFAHYRAQQVFGQYQIYRLFGVWILSFYQHIIDVWSYGQCCIRRKCPGRSCPGKEENLP